MNRRSFITSALAGLATVPILSKSPQGTPRDYAVGAFGPELSTVNIACFRKLTPEEIAALDIDQVAGSNSAALETLMNRNAGHP